VSVPSSAPPAATGHRHPGTGDQRPPPGSGGAGQAEPKLGVRNVPTRPFCPSCHPRPGTLPLHVPDLAGLGTTDLRDRRPWMFAGTRASELCGAPRASLGHPVSSAPGGAPPGKLGGCVNPGSSSIKEAAAGAWVLCAGDTGGPRDAAPGGPQHHLTLPRVPRTSRVWGRGCSGHWCLSH
jgi:hypothetical protein